MERFLLFSTISLKKFQARTKTVCLSFLMLALDTIGIFTPGINFPYFNLLSSTIKSISLLILLSNKSCNEITIF